MPTNYPVSMSVRPVASAAVKKSTFGLLTDALTLKAPYPFPFAALGVTLAQNLLAGGTASEAWMWGRTIQETIKASLTAGEKMTYNTSLAQVMKLANVLQLAFKVTLSQNLTTHQAQVTALGLVILQNLKVLPHLSPEAVYHLALSQAMHTHDALARFYGATLTQAIGVSSSLTKQYVGAASLIQNIHISSALKNSLSIYVSDDMGMTDAEIIQALYSDTLSDTIDINLLYVSPSGFATTWAVNTRTNSVSEYRNYNFTGFTQLGLKYLGCDQNGLYELDGPKDLNASICAEVETGMMQLNATKLSGLKGLYLGMAASGQFLAKICTGDGREYVYQIEAQPNLETTKVNVGKGLRSRYMSFKLISLGPEFRLDTIEFVPMRSDRRV